MQDVCVCVCVSVLPMRVLLAAFESSVVFAFVFLRICEIQHHQRVRVFLISCVVLCLGEVSILVSITFFGCGMEIAKATIIRRKECVQHQRLLKGKKLQKEKKK